jgi:hypothetical protein
MRFDLSCLGNGDGRVCALIVLSSALASACGAQTTERTSVSPPTTGAVEQAAPPAEPCDTADAKNVDCRLGLFASGDSTCMASRGGVACWGGKLNGSPLFERKIEGLRQVAVGDGVVCGATRTKRVECVGLGEVGASLELPTAVRATPFELGFDAGAICVTYEGASRLCHPVSASGTWTSAAVPATPPALAHARVVNQKTWACALPTPNEPGNVVCWGDNTRHQLGDTSLTDARPDPRPVAGHRGFVALAAGGDQACALDAEGSVWCWGTPRTRDGKRRGYSEPTKIDLQTLTMVDVAVGDAHACARAKDGLVFCWGDNAVGQVVPSAKHLHYTAIASVGQGSSASKICLLTPEGAVECAASGDLQFKSVGGTGHAVEIAAGSNYSLSIRRRDGAIDQLDGEKLARVNGIKDAVALAAHASCALRSNGAVACWDGVAPLDPRGTFARTPLGVGASVGVSGVPGGVCAFAKDGSVACWGAMGFEWVFDSTPPSHPSLATPSWKTRDIQSTTARRIPGLGDVVAMNSSCALRRDGTVAALLYGCKAKQCSLEAAAAPGLTDGKKLLPGNGCFVEKSDGAVVEVSDATGSANGPTTVNATARSTDRPALRGARYVGVYGERCAVFSDDSVKCAPTENGEFALVPDLAGTQDLVVGDLGGCAIMKAGGVRCWQDAKGSPNPRDVTGGWYKPVTAF